MLFPSVTLCNINQGRSSLFHAYGLSANKTLLNAVLKQAYFGSTQELTKEEVDVVFQIPDFSIFIEFPDETSGVFECIGFTNARKNQ